MFTYGREEGCARGGLPAQDLAVVRILSLRRHAECCVQTGAEARRGGRWYDQFHTWVHFGNNFIFDIYVPHVVCVCDCLSMWLVFVVVVVIVVSKEGSNLRKWHTKTMRPRRVPAFRVVGWCLADAWWLRSLPSPPCGVSCCQFIIDVSLLRAPFI